MFVCFNSDISAITDSQPLLLKLPDLFPCELEGTWLWSRGASWYLRASAFLVSADSCRLATLLASSQWCDHITGSTVQTHIGSYPEWKHCLCPPITLDANTSCCQYYQPTEADKLKLLQRERQSTARCSASFFCFRSQLFFKNLITH